MGDYIPKSDLSFQDWTGNFITIANANLLILGLATLDMTAITTDKAAFDLAITNNAAAQATAKATTMKKETTRKSTEAKARALVKRIQAKTDVPADLKRQLQITVPGFQPAPPAIPYTPTDLVANIVGSGSYDLTWKRNGNGSTVLFVVEALFQGASDYVQIFTSTKSSFIHNGNPPGIKITYRVKAQRSEVFSQYSNTATVNDGGVNPA